MGFRIPQVPENNEGWGPVDVPAQLKDIPFAPFSKGDKVGKVSDFTQQGFQRNQGRYGNRDQRDPGTFLFNFFHDEQEDEFQSVDNRPTTRQRGGRGRFHQNRFQQRREQEARRGEQQDPKQRRQQQKRQQYNQFRDNQRPIQYSSSVDIRPDWEVVEQINFSQLAKFLYPNTSDPEDISFCGALRYYDKSHDRITTKSEKRLEKATKLQKSVSALEDPVLKALPLPSEDRKCVVTTDGVLTALMCAARSVYPWDFIITKTGDKLHFAKRPNSTLDLVTVAETAAEPVPEDKDNINGVQQLSQEATLINQAFTNQVLLPDGELYQCGAENPLAEANPALAHKGFRYRKWCIGDDIDVVVRCEVDGVVNVKNQDQLMLIRALNEFDPKLTGVDWRRMLDAQRGAVLATELKNNACKLARWTAQALLASADVIKLGYVSRVSSRDNTTHVILGTQNTKPKDFAAQINLMMDNCWGIVRVVADLLLKLEDGKYLLLKDANKPMIRIYRVPIDAFETNYTEEALAEEEEEGEEEEANAEGGDEE